MSAIIFQDTETTGLALDDDIWEYAAIRRAEDGTEEALHLLIEHDRVKCSKLPDSFREDHYARFLDHLAVTPRVAAQKIADFLYVAADDPKPHIVGAVPNFDTERIVRLLKAHGFDRDYWHYHLIDVENLAVGWIAARLDEIPDESGADLLAMPWDSNAISAAVGVDPERFPRHTAMGDAEWAMAIYDAVTGYERPTIEDAPEPQTTAAE